MSLLQNTSQANPNEETYFAVVATAEVDVHESPRSDCTLNSECERLIAFLIHATPIHQYELEHWAVPHGRF